MQTRNVHIDELPYDPPESDEDLELSSLPEYESNATDEQRIAILRKVKEQITDLARQEGYPKLMVDCGRCGTRIKLISAFKCLYCGVWFCWRCGQIHFGMRVPKSKMEV